MPIMIVSKPYLTIGMVGVTTFPFPAKSLMFITTKHLSCGTMSQLHMSFCVKLYKL